MRGSGEGLHLRLVGEKDVDPAVVDQAVKAVAMAVDAEGVGERERDLAAARRAMSIALIIA